MSRIFPSTLCLVFSSEFGLENGRRISWRSPPAISRELTWQVCRMKNSNSLIGWTLVSVLKGKWLSFRAACVCPRAYDFVFVLFFCFFFLKKKKKQVGRTNVLSCFVFFLFFSHLTDFGSGLTRSHQPLLESEETVSWTFDTVKVENEKKKKKKTCHVIFPSFSVYVAAALLPIPPTFTRLLFFRFFNFPRVETKNKKIPPFIWCRPIPSFYKKTKKE